MRSSALINSAVRADTPIDNTSEIRDNKQTSSRAFSRSSKRRGRNNDALFEGARIPTKTIDCQTEPIEIEKPKKVEVEKAD